MFNISDYFQKFKKIEHESLGERDIILSVLHEACGTNTVSFSIEKGVLYIKGSPALKMAIFPKKQKVIAILAQKLPQKNIVDIR